METEAYLLIDFGSTYTKLTLVDIKNEIIVGTSKAITTVSENIMIGYNNAFTDLCENYDAEKYKIVKKLACSSAAGGLKMVTIGLVQELTAEASRRSALGAGARVLKSYCFELTNDEIEEMKEMNIDIILLSGGTDGGNKDVIIHNAKRIAESLKKVPVIVAGNKTAVDEIREIFDNNNMNYFVTSNVMPRLNEINELPVRDKIRDVFMTNIVKAKGMEEANQEIDGILTPTPAAVLTAGEYLSKGTDEEDGIGDLIIIDIGGATTDIHSLSDGLPSKGGFNLKGLKEPFAKRTVEGDLGMRYSALALYEACGSREIKNFINDVDVYEECLRRHDNIEFVPQNEEEILFDEALAKVATKHAMNRHSGTIEVVYTPFGDVYNLYGKDLSQVKYLIGTGGVITHSLNPQDILNKGLFDSNNPLVLNPINPQIMIDKNYILSAMGLLSYELPTVAVRIMKKYIINV